MLNAFISIPCNLTYQSVHGSVACRARGVAATIFDYVTATLLIVLGLGITELLNDTVGLFRERHTNPPDWISLAWAGIIFAFQMQFIWAVFELQSIVEAWSAFKFIVALTLALLLFAAGALIIPRPSSDGSWNPWQRFIDNGRWSLIALFLGVFFLESRKAWVWATVIVAIYSAYEIVKLSPTTYS